MRDLLRAFAKTAGGSVATLLMGMVAIKILAVLIGPSGVGVFSLLRQTQQTAILLAILNGQTALVQGIASRATLAERERYISVAFWITLAATLLVTIVFVALPGEVARALMGRNAFAAGAIRMVRFMAISVLFGAAYLFEMGVLNGHRFIGRAAVLQFSNYFAIAALSYPAGMLVVAGTPTALAWLLNAGAIGAAVSGAILLRRAGIVKLFWPAWSEDNRSAALHFLTLSSTMLMTAALSYGVPLVVRAMIVRGFGFTGAGIFDVAWTLSMGYVMIVLTAFSAYYLPTLSGISDPAERIALVRRVLHLATVLMLPLVTTVIVFKPLVISLLYTHEFMPALHIMRWMLIGDYFKVLSWVFSFTMLAYADIKVFLITEIVWGAMTVAGSYAAVHWTHSLDHLGIIFMVLYLLYLLVMALYVRRRHAFAFQLRDTQRSLAGLAVIVIASMVTWNDTTVHWPLAIGSSAAAALVSWLLLLRSERDNLRTWVMSWLAVTRKRPL
jgi:O-antigen/teichoic acid export membrane protein